MRFGECAAVLCVEPFVKDLRRIDLRNMCARSTTTGSFHWKRYGKTPERSVPFPQRTLYSAILKVKKGKEIVLLASQSCGQTPLG